MIFLAKSKKDGSVIYRVFCSERGGYGTDDSWRLSSGFTLKDLILKDDHCLAKQISGSVYNLHYAGQNGYTSTTFRILEEIMEKKRKEGFHCDLIRNIKQHKNNPPMWLR